MQTTISQDQSEKPARGIWHTIVQCKYCRERFGTPAALAIHKPTPAPKRSRQRKPGKPVKRSLCASERTMLRKDAWRGYAGIWWTVESDDILDFAGQATENEAVILDKKGGCRTAIPEITKPHNGGGCSATVSKLRGALS